MNEDRKAYVFIFKDILLNGVSLSDVKNTIAEKDRPFFNMLMLTAFRQLTFIKNEVLPQFLKKKIPHKQQTLEFILYLGITELLFMDTPDYAVINSYVDIAKSFSDKYGANFINALLRNISRQKDRLLCHRKAKYFSPDFINILKQDYPLQTINDMEEMACIEPPLDISVKKDAHIAFSDAILLKTGSFRLPSQTKIRTLDGFDNGIWWIQDAASSLVVKCLPELLNKKVLDLCAAPGGKTAQLLDAGAIVTAIDISSKRLLTLKENISRLHLEKNLEIICADASKFETDNKYDIVLLDAPCSATGTFRRHPEVMNIKTKLDVKKQAQLQKLLLEQCQKFLKPNGILAYSTCSLAKIEGEVQIRDFLSKHSDFSVLPISLKGTEQMQTKEGFLRILPSYLKEFSGIDGFFIAILQRKI